MFLEGLNVMLAQREQNHADVLSEFHAAVFCATLPVTIQNRPKGLLFGDRYLPAARITTAEISFTSTKAS